MIVLVCAVVAEVKGNLLVNEARADICLSPNGNARSYFDLGGFCPFSLPSACPVDSIFYIQPDNGHGREEAHMRTVGLHLTSETHAVSAAGMRASAFGALATLFGLLLCVSLSGCSSDQGKLGINIDVDGWQGGAVSVSVNGKSDKGDSVSKTVSVKPGEEYESSDFVAGSYTFTVSDSSLRVGETIYAVSSTDDMRDDSKNQHVTIRLAVDQDATDKLAVEKQRLADEQKAAEEAAAKQKAEEEAVAKKAQEEAEAKKQADEAAAQKAAQEKKAAATSSGSNAASRTSSATNSQTVYVTKTGKKYHNDGCSSLKKSKIAMSLSEAEAEGYTPCKNCH